MGLVYCKRSWMGLLMSTSVVFAVFPVQVWAWAQHHAITSAALGPLTELNGQTVTYTDWGLLMKDLGYLDNEDPVKFNEQMEISKKYVFAPQLGEQVGQAVSVRDVLSKYSDEPDWGMDQELFGEDEYPEIWNDAYSMMGGREGLPSQAFRHMYWQKISILHPLVTFKLPLRDELASMGEAPLRAARFIELSRSARQAGQPYWAIRFLADALHYLEDCSQPYHTTQVPTKTFLFMPLFLKNGHGFDHYIAQMTHIVSYYHYAFEDYVSDLLVEQLRETEMRLETSFCRIWLLFPRGLMRFLIQAETSMPRFGLWPSGQRSKPPLRVERARLFFRRSRMIW